MAIPFDVAVFNQYQTGNYRWGQALFIALPKWAATVVAGSTFDPYYVIGTTHETREWIDNHLILDDEGEVLAVHHNNLILAERPT